MEAAVAPVFAAVALMHTSDVFTYVSDAFQLVVWVQPQGF